MQRGTVLQEDPISFMGQSTRMKVWLDSSAARGVFQRQGVGRIRHLEARSLWVQEGLKKKEFELEAVRSEENSADIGTKALNEAKLVRRRKDIGMMSQEKFSNLEPKDEIDGSVGSLEKLERGIKVLMLLGLCKIPGVAGQETSSGEIKTTSWMEVFIWVSITWTVMSLIGLVMRTAGKFIYRETIEVEAKTEEEALQLIEKRKEQLRGSTKTQDVRLTCGGNGDEAQSSCEAKAMREKRSKTDEVRMTYAEWQEAMQKEGKKVIRVPSFVDLYAVRKEPGETIHTTYGSVTHLHADCGKLKAAKDANKTKQKICHECHQRALAEGVKIQRAYEM